MVLYCTHKEEFQTSDVRMCVILPPQSSSNLCIQ